MNEEDWVCVNKLTEEEITVKEFDKLRYEGRKQNKGFQFSYLRVLGKYLSVAKSPSLKILFHIVAIKNSQNIVISTNGKISRDLDISVVTVNKVMKELQRQDLIRKISQGVYILDPDVMAYGGSGGFKCRDLWAAEGGMLNEDK